MEIQNKNIINHLKLKYELKHLLHYRRSCSTIYHLYGSIAKYHEEEKATTVS